MSEGLRPLTLDEISAFRRREYTLDNCGVFYIRGLVTSCGRDTAEGEALRDKFAAAEIEALRARLGEIAYLAEAPTDAAVLPRIHDIAAGKSGDQQKVDPA